VNLFEIHNKLVNISEMLGLCNADTKRYWCEEVDMNLMLSVLDTAIYVFCFTEIHLMMKSQFYEISKVRAIILTNTCHRQLSLSNVSVISC